MILYSLIKEYDGQGPLLSVCKKVFFKDSGLNSDDTPKMAFEELERLGYHCGEFMEATLEFYEDIDIEKLLEKLESSDVFVFDEDYDRFTKRYFGE